MVAYTVYTAEGIYLVILYHERYIVAEATMYLEGYYSYMSLRNHSWLRKFEVTKSLVRDLAVVRSQMC